jgi:hypothetical protein
VVFEARTSFYQHDVREAKPAPWEEGWYWGPVVCLSLFHHLLRANVDAIVRMLGHFRTHARMVVLDMPGDKDGWVQSQIPLTGLFDWYRSLLPGWEYESIGVFDGRWTVALWTADPRAGR